MNSPVHVPKRCGGWEIDITVKSGVGVLRALPWAMERGLDNNIIWTYASCRGGTRTTTTTPLATTTWI
jgi:hypothetical protein